MTFLEMFVNPSKLSIDTIEDESLLNTPQNLFISHQKQVYNKQVKSLLNSIKLYHGCSFPSEKRRKT